ncbi:endonuclease III [Rheinheimera sp. D18]|nr:endonuclease III [Rheinheimera sp. D18]
MVHLFGGFVNKLNQQGLASSNEIAQIYEILSQTYPTFENTDDPWMTNGLSSTPFKSLVSVCLSTMTITKRVVNACVPLYQRVSNFEELLALDDEELRQIIKPVAHYNRKTVNLKLMARQIIELHNGNIPETREELMKLQGVGRKVTDIMLNFVFSKDTIAVDTHVLRVLNRLKIIATDSAEDAAVKINLITPTFYKKHAHEWLIQHGMKVCTARKPKCSECCVNQFCSQFDS